jgi:ankyrin repeat protein
MADPAFLYACAVGDHQTVKKLLDDGQDVHAQSGDIRGNRMLVTWAKTSGTRFHAIHLAAATNDLESAKILLGYGADVNQVLCWWALRPLHIAAYFDNLPMVELLLRNGANVYAGDFERNQAIHFATFSGAIQIVYELLHSGSRLDCANIRRQTPNDYALMTHPTNPEAFQSL